MLTAYPGISYAHNIELQYIHYSHLEPFALMSSDPIMTGCGRGFQSTGYCDWEEAMQDGRIAWTNSQWVVAHISHHQDRPRLFVHKEVDQESQRLYCFICENLLFK